LKKGPKLTYKIYHADTGITETAEEYRARITEDLNLSREIIYKYTGVYPDMLCFPFGSYNKDAEDYTGYDGEDVWQELESYNSVNYMLWDEEDESMQGIVEETDKISNEQYKRQLPD
jgi:peptidoglycan/xylan/chitin deacetylase (PgdA/CDA1 family)